MQTLLNILKRAGGWNPSLYLKIENAPYMALVIEATGESGPSGLPAISVAHYGERNGDLMRDPETLAARYDADPSGEEVRVYGALGQISQVMANLLANAIQAVPVGGLIGISAAEDGGMTEISVRDNGHGMNEEVQRHLFEPFYSTKGDLGNGLGLYISNEIVERHGGSLIVGSQVGTGTEIRVRLPAGPRF